MRPPLLPHLLGFASQTRVPRQLHGRPAHALRPGCTATGEPGRTDAGDGHPVHADVGWPVLWRGQSSEERFVAGRQDLLGVRHRPRQGRLHLARPHRSQLRPRHRGRRRRPRLLQRRRRRPAALRSRRQRRGAHRRVPAPGQAPRLERTGAGRQDLHDDEQGGRLLRIPVRPRERLAQRAGARFPTIPPISPSRRAERSHTSPRARTATAGNSPSR